VDLKQIKELMTAMERFRLTKVTLKEKNGFEITLEKQHPREEMVSFVKKEQIPVTQNPHLTEKVTEVHHPKSAVAESHKPGTFVTSPMVGTFYRSASPSEPAFVKVGDKVTENTVVCIIEAMKVMNEVKAQKSGVIAEVLVENMQPVEFSSKLFRIE
jgi:acetyl-CoA carboxylase biotin carboxyl carrier protein